MDQQQSVATGRLTLDEVAVKISRRACAAKCFAPPTRLVQFITG